MCITTKNEYIYKLIKRVFMEIIILSSLILAGIILLLIELFLLPGASIAGIGSAVAFLGGIYYAFTIYGFSVGIATVIVSVVFSAFTIYRFMKSKTLDKMSLHATVDGVNDPLKGMNIAVGDIGVAVSRLAPMGKVNVNGQTIEVKVVSDMVDQNTEVQIIEIAKSGIVVARIK